MHRVYRATGADLPYGDPTRAHGVAMEGYFWRFSDPQSGRVVVALCGVCRTADDVQWAIVGLAAHPGGFVRTADVRPAGADPARLGVWAGDGAFRADAERVQLDLGPEARLDVRIRDPRPWPRRAFGGLGPAHTLPGLGQYWHPHLLAGRAEGHAVIGQLELDLTGFQVYGEKNWGAGFPGRWWWGQAHGFHRADACVAFAGGEVRVGPVRLTATALIVRFGETLVRLGQPVSSPVSTERGEGHWRLRGRSAGWSVSVDASAEPADAHVLPVPLPQAGHSVPGALEHLAGTLTVTVRRRGRIVFADESRIAGLEHGGVGRAGAELARRAVTSSRSL